MNSPHRPVATLATALVLASLSQGAQAASHREAPGITKLPKVDSTDFYMFRSYEPGREDFVTIIANYMPLQAPYGGPNYFTFDEDAVYDIHIDNDGDAVEDLTFRFDFRNLLANNGAGISVPVDGVDVPIPLRQAGEITRTNTGALNERERYQIDMISGARESGSSQPVTRVGGQRGFTKPVDNIGTKTLPAYVRYANRFIYDINIPGCETTGRSFVGQRAEGFAVNLGEIFDLVNLVPIDGDIFPGGIVNDRANDELVGEFNITSIALEIPIECLTEGDDPVIGGWTSASLPQGDNGALVQVSRLGAPLVNEVVIGLPDKDVFSGAHPTQDGALAQYVTNPTLPELIEILFGGEAGLPDELAPNNFPRQDLVTAFLTGFPGLNQPASVTPSEMIRLNTAVPPTPRRDQSPFGVVDEDLAGFPNGRRPGDDVVDLALRVVMGRLCGSVPLGAELGVDGAVEDTESDLINLGLCDPEDAPVGGAPFIDGAPISAQDFNQRFPYLRAPIPGATSDGSAG